jgi:hypothetical protein
MHSDALYRLLPLQVGSEASDDHFSVLEISCIAGVKGDAFSAFHVILEK